MEFFIASVVGDFNISSVFCLGSVISNSFNKRFFFMRKARRFFSKFETARADLFGDLLGLSSLMLRFKAALFGAGEKLGLKRGD